MYCELVFKLNVALDWLVLADVQLLPPSSEYFQFADVCPDVYWKFTVTVEELENPLLIFGKSTVNSTGGKNEGTLKTTPPGPPEPA